MPAPRPIICVTNGLTFESLKEACELMGVDDGKFRRYIERGMPIDGYLYQYAVAEAKPIDIKEPKIIREPGHYYCEVCIIRHGKETHPVGTYYRKPEQHSNPEFEWPAHVKHTHLCPAHSTGFVPYIDKIILTGCEAEFEER